MKNSLAAVCLFFCVTTPVAHAEVGARHSEPAGGFSLQAPKGWQFRDFPGMKYQIAVGPTANSFTPNLNVVDETYPGSLRNYVDESTKTLKKIFVEFKLIKRDPFVTKSGLRGERMVTTSLQQEYALRQTFYFFPGAKGKYFVVTCSAPAAGGEALDSVFEESMKTFELTQ